jgi:hypothetical protein
MVIAYLCRRQAVTKSLASSGGKSTTIKPATPAETHFYKMKVKKRSKY